MRESLWPLRGYSLLESLLIVVGFGPLAYYYYWLGRVVRYDGGELGHVTSLSVPLSLGVEEYTSPPFTIYVGNHGYGIRISLDRILDGQDASCIQNNKVIDSTRCRGVGRILDTDWELVNNRGGVIGRGSYKGRIYTGTSCPIWIGNFKAHFGDRLKLILRIRQDIQAYQTANPRLEVQTDVDGVDSVAYFSAAMLWAFVFIGSGTIMLLVLKPRHANRL